MNFDANGNEIRVGDVVLDGDGYAARVTRVDNGTAFLDYSEFPDDVPAEATEWETESLELTEQG